MKPRQEQILKLIIEFFIKSKQPVSSKYVSAKAGLNVSPATVRNEMAELEEMGYIRHPHTSAGRVPTEKGYAYYVEKYLSDVAPSSGNIGQLEKAFGTASRYEPDRVKSLAKQLVELSDNAVFVAFAPTDFYYTGMSNLFSQPEFAEHRLIFHLTKVIDHFDQVIFTVMKKIENDIEISIGSQNPFSADCSSVVGQIETPAGKGLMGIIGPTRMEYQKNYSLIKYCRELINKTT